MEKLTLFAPIDASKWQSIVLGELRIDLPLFKDGYTLNCVELYLWMNQTERRYGLTSQETVCTFMMERGPITKPRKRQQVFCREEAISKSDLLKLASDKDQKDLMLIKEEFISLEYAKKKFPTTTSKIPMLSQIIYKIEDVEYRCPILPQDFRDVVDAPEDLIYAGFQEMIPFSLVKILHTLFGDTFNWKLTKSCQKVYNTCIAVKKPSPTRGIPRTQFPVVGQDE